MGNITKRKTKEVRNEEGKIIKPSRTRYRAEVQLQGHPRVTKTFGDRKIAERWIRETEDLMRLGSYEQMQQAKAITVSKMLERYQAEVLPSLRSEKSVQQQLQWWREQLGTLTLAALSPARIIEARDKLAQGDRGPATCNRYLACLSSCCSYAVQHWQWIESNPCSKVPKLKEPAGRTRFLSDEERHRLLDACREISTPLHLAVTLALSTGARRMSVWGLRWRDLDLTEGRETVIYRNTKNGDDIYLPLSGPVVSLLLEHRKVRRLDSDLLFPSKPDSQKPFDFRAPFLRALKQAEIEDFRWHDLRHSAASYLSQQGVDLRRIAAILGHKTLQMSMRYSHLNVENLREDLEKMTGRL